MVKSISKKEKIWNWLKSITDDLGINKGSFDIFFVNTSGKRINTGKVTKISIWSNERKQDIEVYYIRSNGDKVKLRSSKEEYTVQFKMIKNGGGINENALILISCIGAFILGEAMEGMMVIVLYTIGKILEEKALNNSRKSIKDLMNIKSIYANKQEKDKVKTINVEDVKVGDVLVVRKGEKIPVDGTIINGLGKAVKEVIVNNNLQGVKIKSYAYPDEFIKHGSVDELEKIYGLDEENIINGVNKSWLKETKIMI